MRKITAPKQKARDIALDIRTATEGGTRVVAFLMKTLSDPGEATGYRLQAAQMLLNRGWGREPLEVRLEIAEASPLRRYTLEELTLFESAMAEIEAGEAAIEVRALDPPRAVP